MSPTVLDLTMPASGHPMVDGGRPGAPRSVLRSAARPDTQGAVGPGVPPATIEMLRARATHVLASLRADLATVEAERLRRGKCDPVRDLTGRSALERAISETEEMLCRLTTRDGDAPRLATIISVDARELDALALAGAPPAPGP